MSVAPAAEGTRLQAVVAAARQTRGFMPDDEGDALLEAVAANPILLERPIVVRDGRAVIARPPELLLELLDS